MNVIYRWSFGMDCDELRSNPTDMGVLVFKTLDIVYIIIAVLLFFVLMGSSDLPPDILFHHRT